MRHPHLRGRSWQRFWYLAPTAINGAVSLGMVPAVIGSVGPQAWSQVALGQTLGLFGSLVIGLGWPITGPSEIASRPTTAEARIVLSSLESRALLALPVCGAIILVAALIPGGWNPLLIGMGVATALMGLTSSWYFLGVDRPGALFLEAALRAGGVLAGIALCVFFRSGLFVVLGTSLGVCTSIAFTHWYSTRRSGSVWRSFPRLSVIDQLSKQRHGLGSVLTYATLSSASLPLATLIGPAVIVDFSIVDKIQKQFQTVTLPISQMITGRMSANVMGGGNLYAATRSALRASLVTAAGIFVVALFGGAFAVRVLSLGLVQLNDGESVAFAFLVALSYLAQCVPIAVLAPIGQLRLGVVGGILGVVAMGPAVLWLGTSFGLVGILWAGGFSFLTVVATMLIGFWATQSKGASEMVGTAGLANADVETDS